MNFFRIPLNMIVVVMLSQDLHVHTIFKCCVAFLTAAAAFQHWLYRYARLPPPIDTAQL
jgi:positive regulator of sigma E activity